MQRASEGVEEALIILNNKNLSVLCMDNLLFLTL